MNQIRQALFGDGTSEGAQLYNRCDRDWET